MTPYHLVAVDPAAGPCNQSNPVQASFVQGVIIDTLTGNITVYNPLVTDLGTNPKIPPVAITLSKTSVIGLWFGTNAGSLTLKDNGGSLKAGVCVNGLGNGDIFGQFAYCNAVAWFAAAKAAIVAGKLVVPQLATSPMDGFDCPTTRSFTIVDQDQSDNVLTSYLSVGNLIAQNNAANVAALANAVTETNGSDNRLVDIAVDGAIGCTPWLVPDLADPGNFVSALPLNEILAQYRQKPPIAIVPLGDPMTLFNGAESPNKTNLYRAGVFQAPLSNNGDNGNTLVYCQNLLKEGPLRIFLDRPFTINRGSPDPNMASNLYAFLANRFSAAIGDGNLNCVGLMNINNPVTLLLNGTVAIDATFNFQQLGVTVPTPAVPTTLNTFSFTLFSGYPTIITPTFAPVHAGASVATMEILVVVLAFIAAMF